MSSLSEYSTEAEKSALERICLIIDMEGYFLPKFYARELGYANYLGGFGQHFYEMPMKYTDLLPSQVKQVVYVTRRIHGLSFTPTHFENAKPQDQPALEVTNLYKQYRTIEKMVVAYKGGHIEKDLLNQLEIPSVNLEEFGCPKVEELMHLGCGQEVWDCGHHMVTGIAHCSVTECRILQDWIIFKINHLRMKKMTMNKSKQ